MALESVKMKSLLKTGETSSNLKNFKTNFERLKARTASSGSLWHCREWKYAPFQHNRTRIMGCGIRTRHYNLTSSGWKMFAGDKFTSLGFEIMETAVELIRAYTIPTFWKSKTENRKVNFGTSDGRIQCCEIIKEKMQKSNEKENRVCLT